MKIRGSARKERRLSSVNDGNASWRPALKVLPGMGTDDGSQPTLLIDQVQPAAWSLVPCLSHLNRQLSRKDVHRGQSTLAQRTQAEGIVALGQAPSIVVHHQTAVVPRGDR